MTTDERDSIATVAREAAARGEPLEEMLVRRVDVFAPLISRDVTALDVVREAGQAYTDMERWLQRSRRRGIAA